MNKKILDKAIPLVDELTFFFKFNRKETAKDLRDLFVEAEEAHTELQKQHGKMQKISKLHVESITKIAKQRNQLSLSLAEESSKQKLIATILGTKPVDSIAEREFEKLLVDFTGLPETDNKQKLFEKLKQTIKQLKLLTHANFLDKTFIAFSGGFSSGKSSLITSLLDEIELPININPVTAIPAFILPGTVNKLQGYSYTGASIDLPIKVHQQLSHNFIKSLGFNLRSIIPFVTFETISAKWNNICLMDLPGYDPAFTDGYTHEDKAIAIDFLSYAHALIWTIGIDVNGTIPSTDLRFIENIIQTIPNIYVVLNKADTKPLEQQEEILEQVLETFENEGIEVAGVSVYSSTRKKEYSCKKKSLFDFIDEANSQHAFKNKLVTNITNIFADYEQSLQKELEEQNKIIKKLKSLELDIFESGFFDENETTRKPVISKAPKKETHGVSTILRPFFDLYTNSSRDTEGNDYDSFYSRHMEAFDTDHNQEKYIEKIQSSIADLRILVNPTIGADVFLELDRIKTGFLKLFLENSSLDVDQHYTNPVTDSGRKTNTDTKNENTLSEAQRLCSVLHTVAELATKNQEKQTQQNLESPPSKFRYKQFR